MTDLYEPKLDVILDARVTCVRKERDPEFRHVAAIARITNIVVNSS